MNGNELCPCGHGIEACKISGCLKPTPLYDTLHVNLLATGECAMYLEYDWTFNVYRPRFGDTFVDWRGQGSFESLAEARLVIGWAGCKLGRKTDSRTWEIIAQ